jgi:hypothetical protein
MSGEKKGREEWLSVDANSFLAFTKSNHYIILTFYVYLFNIMQKNNY